MVNLGRRSTSTFIAHLSLHGYRPKVQPRSSATRHFKPSLISTDYLEHASIDKMDAEAGRILIRLAHDQPFYDNIDNTPLTLKLADDDNISSSSSEGSTVSNNNSHSMSISSLLDAHSPSTPALVSPPNSALTGIPKRSRSSEYSNPVTTEKTVEGRHSADPIMMLAAAADLVTNEDKERESRTSYDESSATPGHFSSKRKWQSPFEPHGQSTTVSEGYPDDSYPRKRYQTDSLLSGKDSYTEAYQENDTFSKQYLSMKQNPKIKRNAMHAYITYMIYTDLAYKHSRSHSPLQLTPSYATRDSAPSAANQNTVYNHLPGVYNRDMIASEYQSSISPNHPTSSIPPERPWYSSTSLPTAPADPSASSIMARPLTAFLWNDASSMNHTKRRETTTMLPPLALAPLH